MVRQINANNVTISLTQQRNIKMKEITQAQYQEKLNQLTRYNTSIERGENSTITEIKDNRKQLLMTITVHAEQETTLYFDTENK